MINDIVIRFEFYVNDSPVLLALNIDLERTSYQSYSVLFNFQIFIFVMKQVIIE